MAKKKPIHRAKKNKSGSANNLDGDPSCFDNSNRLSIKDKKRGNRRMGQQCRKQQHHHQHLPDVMDDADFRTQIEDGGRREIVEMPLDGNCMFRSLSDQIYGDRGGNHGEVRSCVCDYLEKNEAEFRSFVVLDDNDENDDGDSSTMSEDHAPSYEEYIYRMRKEGEWGGNPELVAAARLYRRNITIFTDTVGMYSISSATNHGDEDAAKNYAGKKEKFNPPDILMSYHDNDHYNSVRDCNHTYPLRRLTLPMEESHEITHENEAHEITSHHDCHSNESNNGIEGDFKQQPPIIPKKLRKNDLCHCGSQLRYKSCCLPVEKRKARFQKWSEANGLSTEVEQTIQRQNKQHNPTTSQKIALPPQDEVQTNFKVLQI